MGPYYAERTRGNKWKVVDRRMGLNRTLCSGLTEDDAMLIASALNGHDRLED